MSGVCQKKEREERGNEKREKHARRSFAGDRAKQSILAPNIRVCTDANVLQFKRENAFSVLLHKKRSKIDTVLKLQVDAMYSIFCH